MAETTPPDRPVTLRLRARHEVGTFSLDVDVTSGARRIALFGPSGSGKTTALSIVAGLIRPAVAEVAVEGRVLVDTARRVSVPVHARRIGYLPQDPLLFPLLTVEQNLRYGQGRAEGRVPFDDVVERLELTGLLGRRPRHLSGGEARRVALGRAVLSEPAILLCDEPFTGLDQRLRRSLVRLLADVVRAFSIPLVLVTHLIDEVVALADDVVVLNAGRVVNQGHPGALMPVLFGLVPTSGATPNLWVGQVSRSAAGDELTGVAVGRHTLWVRPPHPDQASVRLLARPETVALALASRGGTSPRNQIPGQITALRRLDHGVLVELDAGFPITAIVSVEASEELGLELGKELVAVVKASAIEVFAL